MRAFLFPGQGSQTVGMGKDLSQTYELARRRYDEASELLGFDLAAVCFEGPADALRQTRVTQPALYVHSCILTDLLAERDLLADAAAGHSLGEYSALYSAGVFDFAEGLRLVKARADAMQQAGEMQSGTMAAVVGLDDEVVEELCQQVRDEGLVVVPANYNSPGQLVVSGSVIGVRRAVELAKERKARLAKELPVSGAFHSPLMEPAAQSLSQALSGARFSAPRFPVIANVTAQPHTDVESLRRLLAKQLLSPVRWTETLNRLASLGLDEWYEVGNGNVLGGLLKRTVPNAAAVPVGTIIELNKLFEEAS
ncbi:MAG: ACP S-malonyltransferase [bacterium]|nr:ACP S-malonyltransferase [bacterium]